MRILDICFMANVTIKTLLSPFLKGIYKFKTSRKSTYVYKGIKVEIFPQVFHPYFTFSTRHLIDFLSEQDLDKKRILELGAGSGLVSFYCAKLGAEVTASDISSSALLGLKSNNERLKWKIDIVESDLFNNIDSKDWDWIVINPPYYPHEPTNDLERAMYCGSDFAYFRNLFNQISEFITQKTQCIMILSEDCDVHRIESIASQNGLGLTEIKVVRNFWESNTIFRIEVN